MEQMNAEELLNKLLDEAREPLVQKLAEEDLKHLEDAYPYEISKKHEKNMKKIFKQAGYIAKSNNENKIEENNVNGSNSDGKAIRMSTPKKLLIVAAVATLIFTLAIGGVGAWRDSFVKYYLNIKDECSEVKKNDRITRIDIDNIRFGYIPSEYRLKDKKISKESIMIGFVNEKNNDYYISLDILKKQHFQDVNTENAIIEEVIINEKDMVYSERKDMKLLTWREKDRIFALYTNETKEFIFKVAENIKFLD